MTLSIITITYNNAEGLLRTIQSVQSQTFRDFEHIIVDGGSTDGIVDIIYTYENQLAYWVSEPDNGMYHAIMKGMAMATGEIVYRGTMSL